MRKLLRTEGYVHHIENDLRDPQIILFADSHAFKSTNFVTSATLAGSAIQNGYLEGVSTDARFNRIASFAQLNDTSVVLADVYNNCLRLLDRTSLQTSPFAGQCRPGGSWVGAISLFIYPWSVIKDRRADNKILVADRSNDAIKQIDTITKVWVTLLPISTGLYGPTSIHYDELGENLLITDRHSILRYSFNTELLTRVSGSQRPGFTDGDLIRARFLYPHDIVPLSTVTYLVADRYNNRLRVINTANNTVSSICTGTSGTLDGSIDSCNLDNPLSLLLHNGQIYVGQQYVITVLPCK